MLCSLVYSNPFVYASSDAKLILPPNQPRETLLSCHVISYHDKYDDDDDDDDDFLLLYV
jgi:hypothetical protein